MATASSVCDFEDGPSPPTSDTTTDASEDSVEVRVQPVAMPLQPAARRNKRKSSEPRKLKDVPLPKQRHWPADRKCGGVDGAEDAERQRPLPPPGGRGGRIRGAPLHRKPRGYPHPRSRTETEGRASDPIAALLRTVGRAEDDSGEELEEEEEEDDDDDNEEVDDVDGDPGPMPMNRVHSPFSSLHAVAGTSATGDKDGHPLSSDPKNRFLLNLPFDVRNILGPSAEYLLRQQSHLANPARDASGPKDGPKPGSSTGGGVVSVKHASTVGNLLNMCVASSSSTGSATVEVLSRTEESSPPGGGGGGGSPEGNDECNKQKQRNYKNMTRERRIEANARERTRVHTISAAFENLRRAVPSYSCHQKLSKLAILRIACSYILALANLNDMDYSLHQDYPSFSECVDLCTRTIQAEGKARKRKD